MIARNTQKSVRFATPARATRHCAPRAHRGGFTLVEMLVSLAVLTVALAVVTTAFSLTTRTATQAAALSEIEARLREFSRELKADLEGVDPAQSVLVLVGRTQAAAATPDELAAGRFKRFLVGDPNDDSLANYQPQFATSVDNEEHYSDPRADLMMFFSNRRVPSAAPPLEPSPAWNSPNKAYQDGVEYGPVQVVYGHAAIDTAVQTGVAAGIPTYDFAGAERHIDVAVDNTNDPAKLSNLPLTAWHLARRQAILEPVYTNAGGFNTLAIDWNTGPAATSDALNDADSRLLRCAPSTAQVAGRWWPGDVAPFNLPAFLKFLSSPANAVRRPYSGVSGGWTNTLLDSQHIHGILYAGGDAENHHIATVIPNPPPDLRYNLGVQMLPGCGWFQVEFLMPEDPRNSVAHPGYQLSAAGAGVTWARDDAPRWVPVEPGETYVFVPDSAENRLRIASQASGRVDDFAFVVPPGQPGFNATAENRRFRLWPYAIRVTVQVFDPQARMTEPLNYTVVHRFE